MWLASSRAVTSSRLARMSCTVPVKPPNVLVLSGESARPDKDAVFSSVKDGLLAACLDRERYVVYPLSLDDTARAPWKDNCSLLVVPSGQGLGGNIGDEVLSELKGFVQEGGSLLSMHPVVNAAFGFKILEQFQKARLVELRQTVSASENDEEKESTQPREWVVGHTGSCGRVIPEETLLRQKLSVVLAQMRLHADPVEKIDEVASGESAAVVDCIQHAQFEQCSGQAVLSHVNLLSSAASLELHERTANDISELVALKRDAGKIADLLQAVLQELGMECSKGESSSPTLSYLVCSEKLRSRFNSAIAPLVKKNDVIEGSEVDITLVGAGSDEEGSSVDPPPTPTASEIVLLTRPSEEQLQGMEFDVTQYTRWLRTGHLGRTLVYTPVIGSTQTVFTGNLPFTMALKPDMGVVCAAGQQTQGKGRHGNTWLSPKGCMMFSTSLVVHPRSRLHSRLSLLQHIVALSVISAIRTISGYEELPVHIKWPNDIYYQNRAKLGGVLVTTFSAGSSSAPTTAVIGCGVNVSNKYPTMSVNDCIQIYNNGRQSGSEPTSTSLLLPPLTVEALLALTLNQLERYLSLYEHSGLASIERDYYKYWLHSDAVVQLGSRGCEEVTVTGIDEYGYLRVCSCDGEELTLQPDGNSFDITKNLIVMK